jgi:succinyldiaminopimelate transaminase
MVSVSAPVFELPPYPYDRLAPALKAAAALDGGAVDLSVGTPCDPPPATVVEALGNSGLERGYPPSAGLPRFREAAAGWLQRRFGVTADPAAIAACIGTKEFVAGLPQLLHLRDPARDTVLYPAVSYPSYAMGASLAGLRAVPVPVDDQWRLRLDAIAGSDADRALCLWVNTPGNPAGGLDDLGAVAAWGRATGVTVFSDECYIEFTWQTPYGPGGGTSPGRSILETGHDGVVAVHSVSKRSNMAGVRAGFYAGDPAIVHWLSEVRKHAGAMTPGPVQIAAAVALDDDDHVEAQRDRYHGRLERMAALLSRMGLDVAMPGGAFYLWVAAPDGDAWGLTERLAGDLGMIVAPGEFYGDAGAGHVRVAVVQPDDRIALLEQRVGWSGR